MYVRFPRERVSNPLLYSCIVYRLRSVSTHDTYRYLVSEAHLSAVVDVKQLIGRLRHLLRKLLISYGVKQLVDVL